MRLSAFEFLMAEAARNIRRNGLMSVAALGTVAVSMAVLGGALFAFIWLYQAIEMQPKQLEVAVFLQVECDRAQTMQVKRRIQALPSVERVTLVDKEHAFAQMREEDERRGTGIAAELGEMNPLPDRLDVRLADARKTRELTKTLGDRRLFPEVAEVRAAQEALDTLFGIQRVVRNVGGAAAILLVLGTAFVIQNTIRLTVLARRREIRIMQLVGATSGFIRFPLVVEGIFYGAAGSLIAGLLVLAAAGQISAYVGRYITPLAQDMPAAISPDRVIAALVLMGTLIGFAGSVLSIRRFLKRT